MSSNKSQEKKDFLISIRKKIGPGLATAPVWIMQKANKRVWNSKQKRHWQIADLGEMFDGKVLRENRQIKSGNRRKSSMLKTKTSRKGAKIRGVHKKSLALQKKR